MMKQPSTITHQRCIHSRFQSLWLLVFTGLCALIPQLLAAQPTWEVQSDYFGERNAVAQPRTTRGLALSQDGLSVYTGLIQSPNVGTTSLRKVSSGVLAVPGTDHVIFGNGMPGGTGGFAPVGGQPVYAGGATGTFEGWIDVGNSPEAIATDDRGYVYTALTSGITNANRVDIFNSGLTAQVGTIASASPSGVHVHKIGSVYYAYVVSGNGLQRFDVTNVNAPVLDAGYTPGILLGTNVTVDADGTVFVAGNNQVRRISAAGVLTHTVTLTSAQDVAVYHDQLYVVKLGSPAQSITVLNKADLTSGGADLVVPDFGTTRSSISQFRAIDVNAQGQLYVSEENYNGTNAGCGGCITSYTPPVTSFNPVPGPITGRVYFDRVVLSSPLDPLVLGVSTPTNIPCGQATGSIEVNISGGSAPYDYNWDNGMTTGSGTDVFAAAGPNTIPGLTAGTYSITITDATGITATTSATILAFAVTNTTSMTNYTTIQAAIDAAAAGDVIEVCAGTYNESININKSIVLNGAQAGNCAATRSGDESIINAVNGIGINADNVVINGFTIQGQTNTNSAPGFGYTIYMAPPRSGTQLLNNIIQNNVVGSSLANTGSTQAVIQCNWFDSNNNAGPASGNGIYTDEFTGGGVVANVLIDNNKFSGNTSAAITISTSQAVSATTGITITNNEFTGNGRAAFLYNTVSSSFSNNVISGSTLTGSGDLRIFGGVNDFTVMNNFFSAGTPRGIRITDDGAGATNSNITVTENSFIGYSAANFAIENGSGYIGALTATCNWYGSTVAATVAAQISGNVTYVPFLTSGTDGDPGTDGFQPSVACAVVAECPTVSFEIEGNLVTTTNNGMADASESATVEVCDGGTYGVSNLVHSSATNRYSITATPSGGTLLFDGSPAGNADISAAQFDGAQGAHTITLSNPNMGGSLVQVITPYNDVNGNSAYDEGMDCAGDPVTITYSAQPTPVLETSINSVVVTSNNDTADDLGAFSVCNTANNFVVDYFTDLNGVTPAANVKAYQTFTTNNVTVPFCNNCAAPLSAFAGATGTVALVDPTMPGTLEISFRAFLDENNNNVIDADECAGDLVTYLVTVNPEPTFTFTATTTGGSTGTGNTDGGANTVNLYFCPDDFFSFSDYSSNPGSQVGYLEEIPSGTNNVTYGGGAVTVPRAQQDFGPSMVAGLFGGPFGPYNLSSGTSGSLTQTYTPYFDADNSNSYTAGDCLGETITVNYYISAPAQLQTTVNGVQVTSNNDGVDDTGAFSVCHSNSNNLFFTQFADIAGVTPATMVKVQQQFTPTNVTFGPSNGTFPLSAYGTPFDRNVSLVDPTLPGTLLMSFRTFNDINNNDVLDAGECAGDWIVYTVTVNPVPIVTCPANQTVCENTPAYALTGESPAGGTYSGTGVNGGMFDPATAGIGTYTVTYTYSANDCGNTCTFTVTVNSTPTVSFEISGSSVTTTNDGMADASESATVEVCDGGTYSVSNLVHSSGANRYTVSVTPSGGTLLFDGNPASGGDISAAQFDGAQGAHTITLSNPNVGGTLVQVITPYNDVNGNSAYDEGVDCAGDPVTITYSAQPTPLLETSINSVVVTSNNDTADDLGEFSVCNTTNNIHFDYFTDLHGLTPASSVKAYQTFTVNNVTVPFCNNCAAALTAFAGATGTAALVDPSLPGTLEISFRAFLDENNNNAIDADECAGDLVTYTITVNQCCTAPVFTACPTNQTVNAATNQCSAVVNYTATATGTPAPTYSYTFNGGSSNPGTGSGSTFNKGVTNVIVTATNTCGPTNCSFTITVNDTQQPTITCPANIVRGTDAGLCTAVVTYATPTYSDNCTGASVAVVPPSLASGSAFSKGLSSVVWQVTDGAGLTKRCTFTVTVNDNQAPVITCPANVAKNTDPGLCSAVVTYPAATFTDNCPGGSVTVASGPASGAAFPKGITTVIWRATDAAGLTKTCTFRVTVNDTQAPAITCPANQVKNTDPGQCTAIATYALATFTDNCPGGSVVKWTGLASGSAFPKGVNNVTFKATDAAGNFTICTMTITVNDAQLPSIVCPANIVATGNTSTGICKANVVYPNPTATDNCSGVTSYLLSGLASYSDFPQGVTTNVWRAVDGAGASSTCSFTVTVICPPSALPVASNDVPEADSGQNTADRTPEVSTTSSNLLVMTLAPNPATTEVLINVEGLGEKGGLLTVFDAAGRMVWQQPLEAQQTTIMLDVAEKSFAGGLYFVTLRSESATTTKRLMVNKL